MTESEGRPFLPCPDCGADLIPATGRGRINKDGEEVRHRDACRCAWCEWWWDESHDIFACKCGSISRVSCEDSLAFAVTVKAPSASEKE